MPDWEQFVSERLAHLQLAPEVQREVVAEIAAHLEECYIEVREAGSSEPQGETLAQVSDWNALCQRIRRAKVDRMGFARRVVMPGVAAVIVALAALKLYVYLLIAPEPCGPDTTCIAVTAEGPVYLPWLATLLLAGALGAGLARWMGARPVQRLLAAVAPALYLGAETVAIGLLSDFFWRIPIYWVIIPALVCAIGASPFLGGRPGTSTTEATPLAARTSAE